MKVIAYYLPQFHEVEENNNWWGEGFTEWTNVKNAKPLFVGHNQPIEPLNGYYDLLNENVVKWQARLAEKYGIYGFCYYHYWFEGRKILEKPAENLLQNSTINKRFCFCWANHSWRKTWNGTMEMLIEQGYGSEVEWSDHFNYLKDFFQDERYIKIDNMPVFMIFKPEEIPFLDERIRYYDERCKQLGFNGIYVIESIDTNGKNSVSLYSKGIVLREPSISLVEDTYMYKVKRKVKRLCQNLRLKKIEIYNYDRIIRKSISIAENFNSDKDIFLGSFTGWDSTPRHKENGYIIDGYTKEAFTYYIKELQRIVSERGLGEFVFLNAWNEWAEGMYLEPDKHLKHQRLDAIKEALNNN